MQVDQGSSGRATKAAAAAVWLVVAPIAGWFLAFKLRFDPGVTGLVLLSIVLPTVVVGLVGLALGWRLRALLLALAALLATSALAVMSLAAIAKGL